jgi:chemotaxis protein methyltransferase CheR
MELDVKTFETIRELVYEKSGINLGDAKMALVSARVGKRMRALNLDGYPEYVKLVKRDASGEELVQLLDAISTNVTHFFREPRHFELIQELFSGWLKQGQRRFRFWSAACSTGEEPYSLAMTLAECAQGEELDIKILATDISTRVLHEAAAGTYSEARVQSIPKVLRNRYLDAAGAGENRVYTVKSQIKKWVVFKRFNLSQWPYPMQGPMDAIFCRNVMIYFDNNVRSGVLSEMHRLLKPSGYLLVGHAESLTGLVSEFRSLRPSVYVKGRP